MKKTNSNIKQIRGLLLGMMIGGATIVCANQAIQALQNTEVRVSLNGQVQTFKDESTGEIQYPITYNDRTYLPLRNVAKLSGLNVDYDSKTNTAILNGASQTVSNTLDYQKMENILIASLFGGSEIRPYEKVKDPGSAFDGMSTKRFIFDIDNNGTPEIIRFGNYPVGAIDFQVYTMNNDKVVTTSHVFNMIDNALTIYVTEDGIYVYEYLGDGPVEDYCVSKLELYGTNLSRTEIIRHVIERNPNGNAIVEESFYVNRNKVDKNTYNKELEDLNKIKLIQKREYRNRADVGMIGYENLWDLEMYADEFCNHSIEVGKTYIFNEVTSDGISVGHNVLVGDTKLVNGEKIKILSENRQEYGVGNDKGELVDYKVQREDGSIVEIGQIAGRT